MKSRTGKDKRTKISIPDDLLHRISTEHGEWYGFRFAAIANLYSLDPHGVILKEFGLLPDEFTVLANIHDWGEMTANIICAITGRPKNSISRAVTKLTQEGLLRAEADPADRRRTLLNITSSGRKLRDEVALVYKAQEEKMFGFLTEAELGSLDELLLKILRHWGQNHLEY